MTQAATVLDQVGDDDLTPRRAVAELDEVDKLISSIAEHTNPLALSATIDAALGWRGEKDSLW